MQRAYRRTDEDRQLNINDINRPDRVERGLE
jgi:hypothetical protein